MRQTKIMVMAGTRDAHKIIAELSAWEKTHITATATTTHGAELARNSGADDVVEGRLDARDLAEIIKSRQITVFIDATHPFAVNATLNAIKAAEMAGIIYLRFERPRSKFPDNELINLVSSFSEALELILKLNKKRIFHMAGVTTLHNLTERIEGIRIVARVLPSSYSIKRCLELGLPSHNIVAMEGTFSSNFNQALMEEYKIDVVLTKESGQIGGTISKIKAAIALDLQVIVVMPPMVRELQGKKVFNQVEDLIGEINKKLEEDSKGIKRN
jgi:precorrin-6A/cobalt-precorrin-6A reductase